MRTRTRARRGDGGRLREEILDAATSLLVETGDEGSVSVRAVAQRVGVTPPSIYLHFGDKDALIFECCRALMGQLQIAVLDAVADIVEPRDRLRAAAHAHVRFGIANPEPYRIMFMSPHHDVPADSDIADYEGSAAFAVLVDMVRAAMPDTARAHAAIGGEQEELAAAVPPHPPDSADDEAAMAAMGLWAACHGVAALMIAKAVEPIDFRWPDVGRLVDHLIDVHLSALDAMASPSEASR